MDISEWYAYVQGSRQYPAITIRTGTMLLRSTVICSVLAIAALANHSVSAQALSTIECSTKFRAAKAASTLNGQNYFAFRLNECDGRQAAQAPVAKLSGVDPSTTLYRTHGRFAFGCALLGDISRFKGVAQLSGYDAATKATSCKIIPHDMTAINIDVPGLARHILKFMAKQKDGTIFEFYSDGPMTTDWAEDYAKCKGILDAADLDDPLMANLRAFGAARANYEKCMTRVAKRQ